MLLDDFCARVKLGVWQTPKQYYISIIIRRLTLKYLQWQSSMAMSQNSTTSHALKVRGMALLSLSCHSEQH